jgi:hypothetical protein
MLTLQELKTKVEKRISDYIEFDVKEIFEQSDYITIYGGAVRDSIADLEIHDVDILCMPKSAIKLANYIKENYNYRALDLYDKDALAMYKEIRIISEPWTFINNNGKIIQIIKPHYINTTKEYTKAYIDLIKNVDLSCCGVYLDHNGKDTTLMEACKDALIHCLSKTYEINEWAKLYNSNRTTFRDQKLTSRGWTNLNMEDFYRNEISFKKVQRRLKILQLEFKPEESSKYYKIWYEDEYINRPKRRSTNDDDDYDSIPF